VRGAETAASVAGAAVILAGAVIGGWFGIMAIVAESQPKPKPKYRNGVRKALDRYGGVSRGR
jgi:hypothetical protein